MGHDYQFDFFKKDFSNQVVKDPVSVVRFWALESCSESRKGTMFFLKKHDESNYSKIFQAILLCTSKDPWMFSLACFYEFLFFSMQKVLLWANFVEQP